MSKGSVPGVGPGAGCGVGPGGRGVTVAMPNRTAFPPEAPESAMAVAPDALFPCSGSTLTEDVAAWPLKSNAPPINPKPATAAIIGKTDRTGNRRIRSRNCRLTASIAMIFVAFMYSHYWPLPAHAGNDSASLFQKLLWLKCTTLRPVREYSQNVFGRLIQLFPKRLPRARHLQ